MNKLNLLRFLLQSRKSILCDFGGVMKLMLWFSSQIIKQGRGTAFGKLITKAAYLRRGDDKLYQDWINNVEQRIQEGDETRQEVEVIAVLEHIERDLLTEFVSQLESFSWIKKVNVICCDLGDDVFLIRDHTSVEVVFYDFSACVSDIVCADESSAVNFVVLHTLCKFHLDFLKNVQAQTLSDLDVVFSDHDFIFDGVRTRPLFKPGFSADLLYDPNHVPVLFVGRKLLSEVMKSIKPDSFFGYQIILKCLYMSSRPVHIPRILVHLIQDVPDWRETLETYKNLQEGDFVDLTSVESNYPELYVAVKGNPKVSIIIPIRDQLELLVNCLKSIQEHRYKFDVEILVLDNQSSNPQTLIWLEEEDSIRKLSCDYDFNWSKLSNDGIRNADGDLIVLLNNDTIVITPDWIERLVMLAMAPGVGTVGPLLLYPNRTIQHAGVVVGFGGCADHVYIGEKVEQREEEIFVSPLVRREVLACTGACLAFSRRTFKAVGQFDESLSIAGDVDFCLRAYSKGLKNILDPAVTLFHMESMLRKRGLPESDRRTLKQNIATLVNGGDPFYNPNLSLSSSSPMPQL